MIVIGGGVAGCAAAFRLASAGREVTLLEAGEEVGGRARTIEVAGVGVELGAIYLLNSYAQTAQVLADADAADLIAPWSPTAGLWDGSQLHEVRYDFLPTFFRLPLLSWRDKLRLAVGAVRSIASPAPDPFETDSLASFDDGTDMETWARRRFGDRVFEYVVRPLIEPSFGTDCRDLSTPYLTGVLKRAHRASFLLPVEGMGSICRALTAGVDVRLGTRAARVEREGSTYLVTTAAGDVFSTEEVVVATPAAVTAQLLEGTLDDTALARLRQAPYAAMSHTVLIWDEDPWPDHELEMLLPVGAGDRALLGTIVKTSRTSRLVPGSARLMNSYFSSEATRAMSDEQLVAAALDQVRQMLGEAPAPRAEVVRWDVALATSPPGHYARMRDLRDGLPTGLALAGDYLAHLGIETAVVSGEHAARRILSAGTPTHA